ncbi:MAG: hypothetical protein DRQ88_02655 [Epsilonproteobacteria bacterium]|nr:MAG: hypothetical protein DRQ89_02200 [Campylobacterota bacterium]RLA67568.1 MAG: hypothetical protein DRQ88_02655 [Campylobacterota bacterium]
MSKISIFLLIFSFSSMATEFETARLFSTAGAGVGSILMDEATVLNPAPLAFFNLTSVFLQKSFGEYSADGNDSPLNGREAENVAAIISDAKGPFKGSLSYFKQSDGDIVRKRISIATAFPFGKKSSIGITARRTTDEIFDFEDTYYQFVVGAFHSINQYFSAGLVIVDPISTRPKDTKAILGLQLVYGDFISAMVDFGANWVKPLNETFLYRGAVQFMIFKDLYVRGGLYKDKGLNEKGTGVGIGWVSPKLALEIGMKNSELEIINGQIDKKQETSFSASYRF